MTPAGHLLPVIPTPLTPNSAHSFAHSHSGFMPTRHNIYSQSPWTDSLYSPISEDERLLMGDQEPVRTECERCVVKAQELDSLRQQCLSMEEEISFLRAECTRQREENQNLQSPNSMVYLQRQEEGHYYPRRGQRIDKCDYIIQHDENTRIPEEYVALVPGQPMYVKSEWLNHVQASFKNKTKKVAVKNMMSGIYEPQDIQGHSASSLLATPVGKALREYSIMKLGLDGTSLVNAINSKIGTMTRALKAKQAGSSC